MALYLLQRLNREHPFFSFTVSDGEIYDDDPDRLDDKDKESESIETNLFYPAYFEFRSDTDDNISLKHLIGSNCLITNSGKLFEGREHLIEYLEFEFAPTSGTDVGKLSDLFNPTNIEQSFTPGETRKKKKLIDAAFIRTAISLSPKQIPCFLNVQLELFKQYPKGESEENFFKFLNALIRKIDDPAKDFIEEWITNEKQSPQIIPDLPELFKDKSFFIQKVLGNPKVTPLYDLNRITGTYQLKNGKLEHLAALAFTLRRTNKFKDDPRLTDNTFLRKVFLKFFHIDYTGAAGVKAFQPNWPGTQNKEDHFRFLTDF